MIEVFHWPLYFAWRWEHGFPYVVHYYISKDARSLATARSCGKWFKEYFRQRGFTHLLLNARLEDDRIQKAIEYYFKAEPYGDADQHKFYLVEV